MTCWRAWSPGGRRGGGRAVPAPALPPAPRPPSPRSGRTNRGWHGWRPRRRTAGEGRGVPAVRQPPQSGTGPRPDSSRADSQDAVRRTRSGRRPPCPGRGGPAPERAARAAGSGSPDWGASPMRWAARARCRRRTRGRHAAHPRWSPATCRSRRQPARHPDRTDRRGAPTRSPRAPTSAARARGVAWRARHRLTPPGYRVGHLSGQPRRVPLPVHAAPSWSSYAGLHASVFAGSQSPESSGARAAGVRSGRPATGEGVAACQRTARRITRVSRYATGGR